MTEGTGQARLSPRINELEPLVEEKLLRELLELARALEESEERFRLAFKTSPDAIAINRVADGRYVAANDGFARLLGWDEAEILGRTSLELGIWAVPAERDALLGELRRSGKARLEGHFRRRNGAVGIGEMSACVFQIDGVPHILSVTRDVTEEREAERERRELAEALRQAQKLEAVGRLAGGIAHDFNNLLTGILAYTEFVELDLREGRASLDDLAQIRIAAERAQALTQQLLAFARKQVLNPEVVDLNAVVRRSELLLRRTLGEDVILAVELEPELAPIKADVSQLEQILLNLVVNARDAMPRGGRLTIATENVTAGGAPAVRLTVADTGLGIPEESRAHIFEPFYTTKPVGKGTGLGLSTVLAIVEQVGGAIDFRSELGRGTSFMIRFPQSEERVAPERVDTSAAPPRGTETILLVEDDAVVRDVTRRMLVKAGYRVLEAHAGPQALAVLEQARPELLLTDVVMPELSGQDLARAAQQLHRELKVLFVSGYPQQGDLPEEVGRARLLEKPFTAAQLLHKVREVLDHTAE
jgi:PAS domain S-box-containing protein